MGRERAKKYTALDYVYWDDPNEVVHRLQLLTAERSVGNPSHVNEVPSIIEELREAGRSEGRTRPFPLIADHAQLVC